MAAAFPITVTTEDGSEVVVHDLGGDGEPLLLAHATGLHGRVFAPLARELAPQFWCLALDHRAHGDSTASPSWAGDWRGFGEDLLGVVAALKLEKPYVFGHSAGGAAALLAEETEPGTFQAIYCYEPVVWADDEPQGPSHENPLSAGALRRREQFDSFEEALATFSAKPPLSTLRADVLEAYVKEGFEQLADGSVRLKCRPSDEARVYAYAHAHRAYTRLGDVACPVTLARGAASGFIGEEEIAALALRLRRRRVEVFPGLGHFGPLERPDVVAASLVHLAATPRA